MPHDYPYAVVRASDVDRDGMWLELHDGWWGGTVVMTAFYSDKDGTFEFKRNCDTLPCGIEAWFQDEARRLLPPVGEQSPESESA